MALDPLTPEQRRAEFAAPPPEIPPDFGDPTTDRLTTVRLAPPWTTERRRDPHTPRACKVSLDDDGTPWLVLDTDATAPDGEQWLTHDEVRDWPVEHYVSYWPTFAKLAPAPVGEPEHNGQIEGDLGVEVFRG